MIKAYLCVDIGGTKTAISLFDDKGIELYSKRIETKPENGVFDLVKRLKDEISIELTKYKIISGAIASPGPLDIKNGKIIYIPTMGWKDIEIVKIFNQEFNTSFVLINDCSAGALGA